MSKFNLLSVDWDFFFPELSLDPQQWALYDWGHRDGGTLFGEWIWYHRAASFILNQLELPQTSGEEVGFWDRFNFAPDTELYYADSHMYAAHNRVVEDPAIWDSVHNYDAHHDCGYSKDAHKEFFQTGNIDCANWMMAYHFMGAKTHVVYPKWKTWAKEKKLPISASQRFDNGKPVLRKFHRIFVCRSSGWTPSWLDDRYEKFVAECPVKTKINLDDHEIRTFDTKRLENDIRIQQEMLSQIPGFSPGSANTIAF